MNPFQHQMIQAIDAFQQRNPRVAQQLLMDGQYIAVDDIDLQVLAMTATCLAFDWLPLYGPFVIDGLCDLDFLEVANDTYSLLDTMWRDAAREERAEAVGQRAHQHAASVATQG